MNGSILSPQAVEIILKAGNWTRRWNTESGTKRSMSETIRFYLAATLAALVIGAGCNDGSSSKKTQSAMVKNSGQFQKGYQDGSRDAQRAWTDWRGSDMWLWAADRQYKQGYDRGWNDGRQRAKAKSIQKKQLGTREKLTPTPSMDKQEKIKEPPPFKPAGSKKKTEQS
jgi:hypothetical protein